QPSALAKRQDEEQVGSADREREQRQKFRLTISVEEEAGRDQQLDLKGSDRRQIIDAKYDRGEQSKLPRREGHAWEPRKTKDLCHGHGAADNPCIFPALSFPARVLLLVSPALSSPTFVLSACILLDDGLAIL